MARSRPFYEEVLDRDAAQIGSLNNLAWLLATCPDEKVRDGSKALELIQNALRQVVGPAVEIVDSAATTAAAVERRLLADHALRTAGQGGTRFLATDSVERFARVGGAFLGMPLAAAQVELFDL